MKLKKISPYQWELPRSGHMRVPGMVFAGQDMIAGGKQNEPLKQVANVAALPGIVKASMAMPDMHWGYGFPIGGVAAFDWDSGVISPGGVGYDINCGVRLATTSLVEKEVRPKLESLVNALFQGIPSGVSESRPLMAYLISASPSISINSIASSICWSKSSGVNGISVGESAASSFDGMVSGGCRIGRWA